MPAVRHSDLRFAYTLIELTIVLLVMGILAATAAPRYLDALAQHYAEAASKRITADLRYAQQYARQTSTTQGVVFDVGTDNYTLAGLPDPDHPGQTYMVDLSRAGYSVEITSADFGGNSTITFNWYGQPVDAGTIVLTSGNYQRTVAVDVTGNIVVSP